MASRKPLVRIGGKSKQLPAGDTIPVAALPVGVAAGTVAAGDDPRFAPVVQSVAGKTGAVTLVKSDVGLGNVDNTSDANKPVSTATQTALNLKANLASPALTGTPTAPTAAAGTNTTQLATTAFVQTGLGTKQATLVSGTNIKTINGNSILGAGDLTTPMVNLFSRHGIEDEISFVGPNFEITEVVCVADVSGSLAGKHFRIYGPGGTASALDTVAGEQSIDVWFEVGGSGTQPASGAGRYVKVSIATNATNVDVAAAIATAFATDAGFSAGADGAGNVYLAAKTPNNFTNGSAETSGFTVNSVADGSGALTGSDKWYGGVLAPNGKIYGIPFASTSVLVIDPVTNTASTFGNLTGTSKLAGGVLAPNGKIYGIPRDSTSVLVIDPVTNTASTFGNLTGTSKWVGGVLAPNGKIYGIPFVSTSVLVIDGDKNVFPDWYLSAYHNKL